MPNADYWKKRFLQLEAAQNQKGKNCCKEIEQQYRTSIKSIDKKINEWYGRLAANNDVTVQDAYKLLDANELKEFKWDVNQYIKYGRENGVNGRWMKELENASAKYHISRLEAMKIDLRQEIESLTAGQQKTIDKTMRNVYKDGYMHTAYEIQKGMHIGWDFSTPDKRKIDKVINNPWAADGKNFSERIWGNGTKLVGELNQILTQNIILGESPQKAIDKLSKRMDVSKRAAGRLVMTEQAFFSAASQREAFKELDVEEFEIVATLDSHTSNICRKMDGKHFPMSKWEVGVNAPPFHVYCRSTTVPYFDDEEELGIVGERTARNEDGEVYYVPGNMTYKEWEQAFVKGGAKDDMEQLSLPLEKMQNGLEDDNIVNELSYEEKGIEEEKKKIYKELTEEEFRAIKQPITRAERNIIYGKSHFSGYINSSNARKMNELLRKECPLSSDYREIELTLKGVIGRYKLEEDIMVTRFVSSDALNGMFGVSVPVYKMGKNVDDYWKQIERLPELLENGRVYVEKGFLSTSGVIGKNVMNKKGIKMIIKAPKGTNAYVSTNYKESEIIFDENTTLYLTNTYIENLRKADWKIVLECEIR